MFFKFPIISLNIVKEGFAPEQIVIKDKCAKRSGPEALLATFIVLAFHRCPMRQFEFKSGLIIKKKFGLNYDVQEVAKNKL